MFCVLQEWMPVQCCAMLGAFKSTSLRLVTNLVEVHVHVAGPRTDSCEDYFTPLPIMAASSLYFLPPSQ